MTLRGMKDHPFSTISRDHWPRFLHTVHGMIAGGVINFCCKPFCGNSGTMRNDLDCRAWGIVVMPKIFFRDRKEMYERLVESEHDR